MRGSLESIKGMIIQRLELLDRGIRLGDEYEFLLSLIDHLDLNLELIVTQNESELPEVIEQQHVDTTIQLILEKERTDFHQYLDIKSVRERVYQTAIGIKRVDGLYVCPLSQRPYLDYQDVIHSILGKVIVETKARQDEWLKRSKEYKVVILPRK